MLKSFGPINAYVYTNLFQMLVNIDLLIMVCDFRKVFNVQYNVNLLTYIAV